MSKMKGNDRPVKVFQRLLNGAHIWGSRSEGSICMLKLRMLVPAIILRKKHLNDGYRIDLDQSARFTRTLQTTRCRIWRHEQSSKGRIIRRNLAKSPTFPSGIVGDCGLSNIHRTAVYAIALN
mmetsp:Transcript_8133/g.36218  ORF Transcript_8133/g.36218 Transcript_8133/m.36218 type:complete len:123 (+) Transcript_8133:4886-5254(+)